MKPAARQLRSVIHDDQQVCRAGTSQAARHNAAYHEAGHAVVARWEHVRVAEVSVRQALPKGNAEPDTAGRTVLRDDPSGRYLDKLRKGARIGMAGRIAEQLARGRRPMMLPYAHADLRAIQKAAEAILPVETFSEETRKAWTRLQWLTVQDILHREWPRVDALAKALLQREKLTEAEIHRIVTGLPKPVPRAKAATA